MKKNGILTLLFACIPGAGQMYQGYMKRGLSLITMFCLFIIVGSATGLDALVVGCIVVYMYSFFDTFNLRAQIIAENAPADDYLVHINWTATSCWAGASLPWAAWWPTRTSSCGCSAM